MDPQSRPGEFNLPCLVRRTVVQWDAQAPALSFGRRRRVHFPRVERHDRFWGGQKPAEKVTRPALGRRWEFIARSGRLVSGPRTVPRLNVPSALGLRSTGEALLAALSDRAGRLRSGTHRVAAGQWRIGRSSTRPVLKHGPRSLTCARVMGTRYETQRRNESED